VKQLTDTHSYTKGHANTSNNEPHSGAFKKTHTKKKNTGKPTTLPLGSHASALLAVQHLFLTGGKKKRKNQA